MSNKDTPWDSCLSRELIRLPGYGSSPYQTLDCGVNFFILALEQLGAKTLASCEGHPFGFYIWFSCDEELARKIRKAGYFAVEMESVGWSIRIYRAEQMTPGETGKPWDDECKAQLLRSASKAWAKNLNLKPFWRVTA